MLNARNTDPQTSKDAAESFDATTLSMAIYKVIASHGAHGCISDEILQHPTLAGFHYNAITPRYAELLRKNFIEDTGVGRKGKAGRYQRVMRAAKWTQ